ncbi:hypothetical protein HOR79_gp71 [Escherichia phage vB_EcoS_SH2]|uniref:Uncharacterized protein n=1 Tax=Escherichia phage vB_EcoS_SH2 TaxID=1983554 RepID=A0A1Z1LX62_9CAUD|nr:hypothetical protein HOR79_gp71 [Escherichia phage vB_EcoS_SH2]ARW57258.1 hypothetical protein [Escherichia phage vB_EcoS_SH2]WRH07541.1 hypothetical protein [Escherichia phage phiD2-2]
MEQDNFWTRYFAALDAGLGAEWCIKVAYKEITLDDALGNMDMDAESEYNPDFDMPGDDTGDNDDDDYIPW